MNKNIWDKLARLVEIQKAHTGVYECLLACGELCDAVRIEDSCFTRENRTAKEPSYVEALDLALCAFEVYIMRGGTYEILDKIFNEKLDKFAESQKKSLLNQQASRRL